jgi:hypothetical protein
MSYLHSMIHSIILIWHMMPLRNPMFWTHPFLNRGITWAIFQSDGNTFSRKDLLNKLHNDFDISSFTDTNIQLLIISGKHVFNHLLENKLLYKFQSGFITGHSKSHQLIELYHRILLALEAKQVTSVTFADISKAFDTVWVMPIFYPHLPLLL